MKFIKQFSIILIISLIGEALHYFIPLPVPASIYGLLIMLAGLQTKLIPLDSVQEASYFADVHTCRSGTSRFLGTAPADPHPFSGHHHGLHSGGYGRLRENYAVFYKI